MGVPLTGELSFATARDALDKAQSQLGEGNGPVEVDLSGVTRADSAGVAVLLELARLARARGREIRFARAPAQLRRLAEFFGVAGLLALTA